MPEKITIEITSGRANIFYSNEKMSPSAHFLAAYAGKNQEIFRKEDVLRRVSEIIDEHQLMR